MIKQYQNTWIYVDLIICNHLYNIWSLTIRISEFLVEKTDLSGRPTFWRTGMMTGEAKPRIRGGGIARHM